jgi:hypothetical protein
MVHALALANALPWPCPATGAVGLAQQATGRSAHKASPVLKQAAPVCGPVRPLVGQAMAGRMAVEPAQIG